MKRVGEIGGLVALFCLALAACGSRAPAGTSITEADSDQWVCQPDGDTWACDRNPAPASSAVPESS